MALHDTNPLNWVRKNVPERIEGSPYYQEAKTVLSDWDEMMGGFFHDLLPRMAPGAYAPEIDVVETEKELKVLCDLPGIDEKDIDISLAHNMLCIKGEKKCEHEETDKGRFRMERRHGTFCRTVPMPKGIDEDKISADFNNGILTVHLPKTDEYKKSIRSIHIKKTRAK